MLRRLAVPRRAEETEVDTARPWVRSFALLAVAWALVVAALGRFAIAGDAVIYYRFLRRFIGDGGSGFAYQFGSALWNLPFYAVGTLVGHGAAAIAVAANAAVLIALFCTRQFLAGLGLPAGSVLLAVTLLGTPLWYYGLFDPGYAHCVDAMLYSVLALLLARYARSATVANGFALGAVEAALITVRYANVGSLAGAAVIAVAARTLRPALGMFVGLMVSGLVLFLLPVIAGVPYGIANATRPEGPPRLGLFGGTSGPDPLAPLKMLITPHRGLFLWTPLTLISVVGVVLYLRGPSRERAAVAALATSGIGLLLAYVPTGRFWDGGFSFSQRYLACLFPLFAVGVAECVRRRPKLTWTLAAACAAYSVFIGLNLFFGYDGVSQQRGVQDILGIYVHHERTPTYLGELVVDRIRARF